MLSFENLSDDENSAYWPLVPCVQRLFQTSSTEARTSHLGSHTPWRPLYELLFLWRHLPNRA